MSVSHSERVPVADVRDAIRLAEDYVQKVLMEEQPINLGLEETEYEPVDGSWKITIGFSRTWNVPASFTDEIRRRAGVSDAGTMRRSYKVVTINDAGVVVSMKNRHE